MDRNVIAYGLLAAMQDPGNPPATVATGPDFNYLWFHMRFPGWQQ